MKRPRMAGGVFCAALLLLLAGVVPAGARDAPDAPQDPAPGYVGGELCAECHGDYAEVLASTPHGKAGFDKLTTRGCEECHGPGELHLEDPEVVENQPRIDEANASQVCQSCHDGAEQFFWKGSMHETRDVSCTSCHSVHAFESETAQLKAAVVTEQCFSCHKDIRAQSWKRSHHPVREGRITCTDCHNPHGAQSDKMVRAASINEQCYSCHAEKRGPFLWDHAPVRESCVNCHSPHGSNHLKLQKTSVPYICQQCHINTRHPGTLYDRTRLADGTNPANREFSRACLNCHSQIHGSNHPSGWALQR